MSNFKQAILEGNLSADALGNISKEREKNNRNRIKELKEKNVILDNKIQEWEKRVKIFLKEKGKANELNSMTQIDELIRQLSNLKEKIRDINIDESREIERLLEEGRELLNKLGKEVEESYKERTYIGKVEVHQETVPGKKWQIIDRRENKGLDKFRNEIGKINFVNSISRMIGIRSGKKVVLQQLPMEQPGVVKEKIIKENPIKLLSYDIVTIESFFRNYSKISEIIGNKNFDSLSDKEKKQLERKLENIGYVPDGGKWDIFGYSELKSIFEAVRYIKTNGLEQRVRKLENLLILGVNPIYVERSKVIAENYLNENNVFDFIGDYDGNGELSKDDKGIYSGQQISEMFKRFEAMNEEVFYKNLTNLLNSVSEDYGWGNVNIKDRTDLVKFLKKYPEAKYVLIKLYERLPIENLAMSSGQFNKYLEAERKVFENNKELLKLSNLIEKGLIEKYRKKLGELEKDLNEAIKKAKTPEEKERLNLLLNKLKSPSGQIEIINKLKPNIIALMLNFIKGKEGLGLGANWSKQVNMIIDSINFSIGVFKGKDGFTPGLVLSINKNLNFGKNKENQVNIVAGTAMWIVQFAGLTLSHAYGFKKLDAKSFFDYNRKLNKVGLSLGISTVGWGISFEKGFDRIEAVRRNTERFAKLLDILLKEDLRKANINVSNLAEKFKVSEKDLELMIKHIKQIVNIPGYKNVDWKILSSSIKEQYIRQFYDIQMMYLADYRNNEITGWTAGIAFIAGFFPIPFISPKITHYSRDFVEDKFDLIRDYSYISLADKELNSEKLSIIAKKLEAVFGDNVDIQVTENDTLLLKTKNGKSVLDEVNVYVSPDKITQIKINKDGSLEIGNVGKIYATFLAQGKDISNYLMLGTDKINGAIKITKEISKDFVDNKIDSIKEKIDLKELVKKLPEEVMRRFIEKDGKIYFDVNGNNQIDKQDVDVTYGGYEIIIDPNGNISYTKIDGKELVVKYYKEIKSLEEKMKLPDNIEYIKRDFDSLWEDKWIDLAKLRTKLEFKGFEKAKIEGNFEKAFNIGIDLLKKYLPFASNLIEEINQVEEKYKPYIVDIMDRYFRADIEFSSKIHRYQLLNKLINSKDFDLLTDKEKKVVRLLIDGNFEKAKNLAKEIGYIKGNDNPIAIMFNYLDARLQEKGDKRAGDAFRSIFKQLYFAFSDHFGGEIFGERHDRRRVFKEIFRDYGLDGEIVDNVLDRLKDQIDKNDVQSELLENVVAFMAVGGIVDTGGKIESTGKGLHGQVPGIVEAIRGTEVNVVDENSMKKIVELIMENEFYKQGIKKFVVDLFKKIGINENIRDEQLRNLLTNGVIRLNNGYEIKLNRQFIAFAYDVCGNVSVGMKINGFEIKQGTQTILKAEGVKFGIGAEGVMNIDPASVMSLVVGIAWGKGEKNKKNQSMEESSSEEGNESENENSSENGEVGGTTISGAGNVDLGDQGESGSDIP